MGRRLTDCNTGDSGGGGVGGFRSEMTTVVETVRAIFFTNDETEMIEKDKREENTKKKTRECGDRYSFHLTTEPYLS